jgi:hypothetical protein
MNQLNATAAAGTAVAAVSTWAYLAYPGLLIWAAFIGWASFAHSGGSTSVLAKVLAALAAGVVIAWAVAMGVVLNPVSLPTPVLAAALVGLATAAIVKMSVVPLLSIVPAVFYGFAASFAYLTLTPSAFTPASMTALSSANFVLPVGASLLSGALLGQAHAFLAGLLAARA